MTLVAVLLWWSLALSRQRCDRHDPGQGWQQARHCKKYYENFGQVCFGHRSISVASGCDPAGAVLHRDVMWGKKTQPRVILRNFCPESRVPLKLCFVPALAGANGWDEQLVGGGDGLIIGRKSELAWVQVSGTPQEELGAAGGFEGVSQREVGNRLFEFQRSAPRDASLAAPGEMKRRRDKREETNLGSR